MSINTEMRINTAAGSYIPTRAGNTAAVRAEYESSSVKADKFERSGTDTAPVTYSRAKSSLAVKNEAMKDAVSKIISGQADRAAKTSGIEKMLSLRGIIPIKSDGSDDFWGAEKTAGRILDFAKALAGDDKKAFDKVKNAFNKAFGDCERIWGGRLPSVCYDTLSRVRQGFDDWDKEKFSDTSTEDI